MEVRFVSSLTAEDEEQYAPALLAAVGGLLDHLGIAYTLQVRTSGDKTFRHIHSAAVVNQAEAADPNSADSRAVPG